MRTAKLTNAWTWCAYELYKSTIVGNLEEVMVKQDGDQEVKYYSGIGTYRNFADRFVGGRHPI